MLSWSDKELYDKMFVFYLLIIINCLSRLFFSQTLECNSICQQFSKNDPNFNTFTAEEIENKLENGECKSLPERAFGAPPIGSTMIFGYRKCISIPTISSIHLDGTICIYLYGWVYPINLKNINSNPQIINGDLYIHYSIIFDANGIPKESQSLCSDSQGTLSSFKSLDDQQRTPLIQCPTLNTDKLCNNNGPQWQCIWKQNENICLWENDPNNDNNNNNHNNDNNDLTAFNNLNQADNHKQDKIDVNVGIDLSILSEIVLYSGRFPNPPQKPIKIDAIECALKLYINTENNNEYHVNTEKYWDPTTNSDTTQANNDNNKLMENSWFSDVIGSFGYGPASSFKDEIDEILNLLKTDNNKIFGGIQLDFKKELDVIKSLTNIIGKKEKTPSKSDKINQQLKTAMVMSMQKTLNFGFKNDNYLLSNSHCIVKIENIDNNKPQSIYFSNFYQYFNSLGLGEFHIHIPNANNPKNKQLTKIRLKLKRQNESSLFKSNKCILNIGDGIKILETNNTISEIETDIDLISSNSKIIINEEIDNIDQYLGCFALYDGDLDLPINDYKDNEKNDREPHLYHNDDKTNSNLGLCQERCYQYKYFVLKYNRCYCSDMTPKNELKVNDTFCDIQQDIVKSDIIGPNPKLKYPQRLFNQNLCLSSSIDLTCTVPIIAIKIYRNSFYFGCYQLGSSQLYEGNDISITSCKDYCRQESDGIFKIFKYFAIYQGNKCGCLENLPQSTKKVNNSQCNLKCDKTNLYLRDYKECGGKTTNFDINYVDIYSQLIGNDKIEDEKYKAKLRTSPISSYGGKSDIYIKIEGISTNELDKDIEYPIYFWSGKPIPTFDQISANSQNEKDFVYRRKSLYFKGKYIQINKKAFIVETIEMFMLNINELSDNIWHCLTCNGNKAGIGYATSLYFVLPSSIKEIYITQIADDTIIKNNEENTFNDINNGILTSYNGIQNGEELGLMYRSGSNKDYIMLSTRKCFTFGKKSDTKIQDISLNIKMPMFGNSEDVRNAQSKGNNKLSATLTISNIHISPSQLISSSSLIPTITSLSSDSSFIISYLPKLIISYQLTEINNNPITIPIEILFPDLSHEIPSKPCNSIYKPPSNGNNRMSCCGIDGPGFCLCDQVKCRQKCKDNGGIKEYKCDEENTQTTIPSCQCWIDENQKLIILILIIIISCVVFCCCCGLIIFLCYKYNNDTNNNGTNNNNNNNNVEKAVYDKEFDDDPEADIPMLPDDNDIMDYYQDNNNDFNNDNNNNIDNMPPIPDNYFDDDYQNDDGDDDEFW